MGYQITKKFLIQEYTQKKKPMHKIAKKLGCCTVTILKKLRKYKIPSRKPGVFIGTMRPDISEMTKGNKNPNFKHNISEEFLIKEYLIKKITATKIANKISCSKNTILRNLRKYNIKIQNNRDYSGITGKNNYFYGKILKPFWTKYKNIKMRSSWEVAYAQFLDLSGYKWKYESKTFNLGNTTYTPDFYIPEWDLYIEIKGYISEYFRNKMTKFRKIYKDINFQILTKKELIELGVIT